MFQPIEQLEDRCLLAASITQQGGTLVIEGNGADDAVLLVGSGNGSMEVFSDQDGDGVVDNETSLRFSGVQNIRINLRGGDDVAGLSGVSINGNLSVQLGSGDDGLLLVNCDIDGSASINTAGGNDTVALVALFGQGTIDGNLDLTTGGGTDVVVIDEVDIDGRSTINLGNGNDQMLYDETTSSPGVNASWTGGGGSDLISGKNTGNLLAEVQSFGGTVSGFELFINENNLSAAIEANLEARSIELLSRLGAE